MHDSDLIVRREGATPLPVPAAVIAAIDERPLGGASLTSGTTGGGTYAQARDSGAIHLVTTLSDLKLYASGDAPAVVLVAEGRYVGAAETRIVQACHQACEADDPIPEQTVSVSDCTHGEAIFELEFNTDTLRVGSNKTIIGLGKGAHLVDTTLVLDGSSNVILRNLAIEEVGKGIVAMGNGLSLSPAHHVWLDHMTLRDVSHTSLNIASSFDQENAQALVDAAGFVTASYVQFDGFVSASCSQRSQLVLTANRSPALTVTHSWFEHGRIRAPNFARAWHVGSPL
ncbi:MAG: hypothetical protein QM756_01280 [Polyangiaceae bacterium]